MLKYIQYLTVRHDVVRKDVHFLRSLTDSGSHSGESHVKMSAEGARRAVCSLISQAKGRSGISYFIQLITSFVFFGTVD